MQPLESLTPDQQVPPPRQRRNDSSRGPRRRRPRAARRRRAVLLGLGALIIAAVVAVIVSNGGGNSNTAASPFASSNLPKPSAKINLVSPSGNKSTFGLAVVVRRGNTAAIAIVGKGLQRNGKHNAYAIWLYNSPTDSVRLGFVNPGVGKNGHLDTAGRLPEDASRFNELLVTLETTASPSSPGPVVLKGAATGI